ncbi:hypothetical protein DNTS_014289, partial [Danionella cerebrum]
TKIKEKQQPFLSSQSAESIQPDKQHNEAMGKLHPSFPYGWHDLDNSEYDCWPIVEPNDYNMISCGGLEMAWVQRPPEKVTDGEEFNVTYSVSASDSFYEYAVKNKIFQFSNASEARSFCLEHECPPNWNSATEENCCVYHANIHSCPLALMRGGGICGPWIPDDGEIVTHTVSKAGKMSQLLWTSKVVLVHLGVTSVIAHVKVGQMHAALESKVLVVSAQVCGDEICELEESCLTCPADCGVCPMPTSIKVAIGLPVALFCRTVCYTGFCSSSTASLQTRKRNSSVSRVTDVTVCTGLNSNFTPRLIQPALYDGRTVAVKHIQKKHFTLTKSIRKEVKEVRELDHPNLSKFIGGCIEVPFVSIITEYCPKGSLSEVLLNEDVPINWGFRKEDFEDMSNGLACENIYRIYCAPEVLLRISTSFTVPADVYSYSIILVEIATRSDLISEQRESVKLDVTWRPGLPKLKAGKSDDDCPDPDDYCELIKRCWSHSATVRPTFEQVKKILEKMNPHKVSPVDMMMNLMEKYSKHLESIVAERTQDLLQEKQKTDRLLYSMLPKPVADDLRQGRTTEAQSYSSATVYFRQDRKFCFFIFIDIVGFTQLSGSSTPHQVVDFLNKLYTTFDDIIDNYDVYKVETIGDAYMVVSGVPKENGINHAGEIASMALDLISVCHAFKIPHKPSTQLKIRAGIHTGPVVAGVVGTKMPRYCLFGDTVNTASRMESTSEALKIQCSGPTADLLHTLGGYVLMCRGSLNVKAPLTRMSPSRLHTAFVMTPRSLTSLNVSSNFCTENNVSECLLYINQELSTLCFPPVFHGSDSFNDLDAVVALNNIYELLQLHRRAVGVMEEMEVEQLKSGSDLHYQQLANSRLKDQLELSKKESTRLHERERQMETSFKSLQNCLKETKEEVQRLQGILASRASQYNHDIKRREREHNKVKERLNQLLIGKKDHKQGMDVLNYVGRSDGKRCLWKTGKTESRHEGEMYKRLLSEFDNRQRELMQENVELKKVLQHMKREMMGLLNPKMKCQKEEKQCNNMDKTYSDDEEPLKEPGEMSCDHAREKLTNSIRQQWRKLKHHVERLDSQASMVLAGENEEMIPKHLHEEETERLELEIQQCKEFIQTQQQLLQQQLNTPCDEETAAVLNDSYMLEEKERLKEEWRVFEEQRKTFETERRNFTEAAIRLSHERKSFEDDRALWVKHQFLNTTFADQIKPQCHSTDDFLKYSGHEEKLISISGKVSKSHL